MVLIDLPQLVGPPGWQDSLPSLRTSEMEKRGTLPVKLNYGLHNSRLLVFA